MGGLKYPCDETECSKANFEEDVKGIRDQLKKNYSKCFKEENCNEWLDNLTFKTAMSDSKKDIKKNFSKEMAKEQTAWEKAKVTQEELQDFLDNKIKGEVKEGDWKGLKKKLKEFIKAEYKKDRRLRVLAPVKKIQFELPTTIQQLIGVIGKV